MLKSCKPSLTRSEKNSITCLKLFFKFQSQNSFSDSKFFTTIFQPDDFTQVWILDGLYWNILLGFKMAFKTHDNLTRKLMVFLAFGGSYWFLIYRCHWTMNANVIQMRLWLFSLTVPTTAGAEQKSYVTWLLSSLFSLGSFLVFSVMRQIRGWLFLIRKQLSTLIDREKCLAMNLILFVNSQNFYYGDLGDYF